MKLLVPTAGVAAAGETAEYAIQVARSIDAEVLVLHVLRPGHAKEAGELTLEIFKQAGREAGVNTECFLQEGLVIHEIIEFAEVNDVDLILMGASNGTVVEQWLSSDIRGQTSIPVLVIPYQVFA